MAQTDIMSAIRQIAAERRIEVDEIVDAIKQSIKTVFEDSYNVKSDEEDIITVDMDPEKGHIAVYANKTVVNNVENKNIEISLEDAKKINSKAQVGQKIKLDVTPEGDFGRIAAQTARQVILQKLREAEKESVIRQFQDKVGQIITVNVQRVLPDGDIICEVSKAKAIMPKADRVSTEFYKLGGHLKVLLKKIEEDPRGKFMVVSRSDPDFLKELFAIEIPEIESGTVEIMAIAREAGSRSKVAVRSTSEGVDPIGSCVGQKGVRINAISNELKNGNFEEKIDIILWDDGIEQFLMNAIRPAEAIKVELVDRKEKQAIIVVPDGQLSLAIGKEGQNARLSSKLTGWTLDIKGEEEYKKMEEERKADDAKLKIKNEKKSEKKEEAKEVKKSKKVKEEKPKKVKVKKEAKEAKKTKKKVVKKA